MNFLKRHKILIAIILAGVFLRLYKGAEYFAYSHDNDLASWIIKDIVVDKHWRLIGQLTSTPGIFIGPIFYYLLIPFYLISNMDPIGSIYLGAVFGILGTLSFYFVFKNLFGKEEGLIGALLYSCFYFFVFNDREIVPTLPVVLWSLWYLFNLNLYLKNNKYAYIFSAILFALIWHLNFALILVAPLIPLAIFLSKQKINFKCIIFAFITFILLSLPLILFESRHGFSQTHALLTSLTTDQQDVTHGIGKVDRVMQVVLRDVNMWVIGPGVSLIKGSLVFILGIGSLGWLRAKGKISREIFILMLAWIALFIGFFSFYSKVLSEYYLNGMAVIWLAILVLIISESRSKLLFFGLIFINLFFFAIYQPNHIGYLQRKAFVDFVYMDAKARNYPCVAVSYITDPGYDLGYRYFYYLKGLKVNQPKTLAPVYSLVFPHTKVDRIDKSFGSIGLVLPDYQRYNEKGIAQSCSGEDGNLTYPMFGFTK